MKHIKKRLVSLLTASAIAIGSFIVIPETKSPLVSEVFPALSAPADAEPYETSAWERLRTSLQKNGTVTLTEDVKAGEGDTALEASYYGGDMTLDLNGHTIDRGLSGKTPTEDGYVIKVSGGTVLTVTDSVGTGKITGGSSSNTAGGIYVENNAGLKLSGGTVTGNVGGAVSFADSVTLSVSGSPVVAGNTAANGSPCNIILPSGKRLTVDGELSSASVIALTAENGTAATGGKYYSDFIYKDYSISDSDAHHFISDDPSKHFIASGGSLKLVDTESGYTKWSDLESDIYNGGYFRLDADIKAGEDDSWLMVGYEKSAILDLNGHTIDRGLMGEGDGNIKSDGSAIYVSAGEKNSLILLDTSAKKTGKITGGNDDDYAGGIFNYTRSTFIMLGGTITGNCSAGQGGGVNSWGTFIMLDGKISGNSAEYGGGVESYSGNSVFRMFGGTISGNNATESGGGLDGSGNICINGGTVTGNTAVYNGGGIHCNNILSVYGGTVSHNTARAGGGISCNGTFAMYGGEITDNTSTSADTSGGGQGGGGVFATGDSFLISGGKITGNTAANKGGGAFLFSITDITVSDCLITGNTADISGSGVYYSNNSYEKSFKLCGSPVIKNNTNDNFFLDRYDLLITGKLGSDAELLCNIGYDGSGYSLILAESGGSYQLTEEDIKHIELTYPYTDPETQAVTYRPVTLKWVDGALCFGNSLSLLSKIIAQYPETKLNDNYSFFYNDDRNLTEGIEISRSTTLDLNGFTIDGKNNTRLFYVDYNARLTIKDSSDDPDTPAYDGKGRLTGGCAVSSAEVKGGGALLLNSGTKATLLGGTIADCGTGCEFGGGVYVDGSASFTMENGVISGCSAEKDGGGVYLNSDSTNNTAGSFTMTGGTISSNTSRIGADDVYASAGTGFTVSGSPVTGTAVLAEGVNVLVSGELTSEASITVKRDNGTVAQSINDYTLTEADGTHLKSTDPTLHAYIDENGETAVFMHDHVFTYSLNDAGDTVTATCSGENCGFKDNKASIKITKPAHEEYGDGKAAAASLSGTVPGVNTPAVVYKKGTQTLSAAPTAAGTYTASITLSTVTASVEYTIKPRAATVTAGNFSKTYGSADPTFTAAVDGLLSGESPSLISYAFSRENGENVGGYAVTPVGDAVQGNYSLTYKPGKLTITQKDATVTADSKSKALGDSDPGLTATVTGAVGNDKLSYTLSREKGEKVGKYAITATIGENPNYKVKAVDGIFTIAPADYKGTKTASASALFGKSGEAELAGHLCEGGVFGEVSADSAFFAETPSISGTKLSFTLKKDKDNAGKTADITVPVTSSEYNSYNIVVTVSVTACPHDETELRGEKAAACTEDGYTGDKVCKYCGELTEKGKVTAKLGHKEGGVNKINVKEPTCTEDGGYDEAVCCSRCGEAMGEAKHTTIPKLGHKAGGTKKENVTEPTCTEDGSYDEVPCCERCGETMGEAQHKTLAKLGHKAGEPVCEEEIKATCYVPGEYYNVSYCSRCGTELDRAYFTAPKLEHKAGEAVRENEVMPDCNANGGYDLNVYCEYCGEFMSTEHITLPKLGHTPGEPIQEYAAEPTCTKRGGYYISAYCKVCGALTSSEYIEVPRLGHNFADGVCKRCGVNEINSLHVFRPDKTVYLAGEPLDLTGGMLCVTFADYTQEFTELDESMVSGFDSEKEGKQSLTVSFRGLSASFEVIVERPAEPKKPVSSIKLYKSGTLSCYQGERLDLGKAALTVTYSDNEKETIPLAHYMISGLDNKTPGKQKITITYGGALAEAKVNVEEKKYKIVSLVEPYKTEYYIGEELDLTGGSINVEASDGEIFSVPMTSPEVKADGFKTTKIGKLVKVEITYRKAKKSFNVRVVSYDPAEAPVRVGTKSYMTVKEAFEDIEKTEKNNKKNNKEHTPDYVITVLDDVAEEKSLLLPSINKVSLNSITINIVEGKTLTATIIGAKNNSSFRTLTINGSVKGSFKNKNSKSTRLSIYNNKGLLTLNAQLQADDIMLSGNNTLKVKSSLKLGNDIKANKVFQFGSIDTGASFLYTDIIEKVDLFNGRLGASRTCQIDEIGKADIYIDYYESKTGRKNYNPPKFDKISGLHLWINGPIPDNKTIFNFKSTASKDTYEFGKVTVTDAGGNRYYAFPAEGTKKYTLARSSFPVLLNGGLMFPDISSALDYMNKHPDNDYVMTLFERNYNEKRISVKKNYRSVTIRSLLGSVITLESSGIPSGCPLTLKNITLVDKNGQNRGSIDCSGYPVTLTDCYLGGGNINASKLTVNGNVTAKKVTIDELNSEKQGTILSISQIEIYKNGITEGSEPITLYFNDKQFAKGSVVIKTYTDSKTDKERYTVGLLKLHPDCGTGELVYHNSAVYLE